MSKRKGKTIDVTSSVSDTCHERELNVLLNRYQDNELEVSTRERVRIHLEECVACRAEFMLLEEVISGVKSLSPAEPMDGFTGQLMEKVHRSQEKSAGIFGLGIPSVVYSIVFILFLGLGIMVNGMFNTPEALPTENIQTTLPQEVYITQLLNESHQLSLIDVQDTTMALFKTNGTATGESYD